MADLVLATHLVHLPVGSVENRDEFGRVRDVVIQGDTGRFLGLTITKTLFSQKIFIGFNDITFVDRGGVILEDSKHLVPFETIKTKLGKHGRSARLLGKPVVTKSGKRLGRLEDLTLSLVMGVATQLHVKGWIHDRLIDADQIVEITPKKIIVKNDLDELPLGAPNPA